MFDASKLYSIEDVKALDCDYQKTAMGWLGNSIASIKKYMRFLKPLCIKISANQYDWEWNVTKMKFTYADSENTNTYLYMYVDHFL